jgi:PRTRC genetic system protein A
MLDHNLIPLYLYLGHPMHRPERLYDYVLAEQGIIKRVETPYASADALLVPISEWLTGLHLQPYPLQPLRLKIPRIPGRLLMDVLADARTNIEIEFMYHFRFSPEQGWTVTRPAQAQSWARVGYQHDPTGVVLDLHSHHVMPAFFSSTDDGDEQGGRFYAVMGHLDRPNPQLILRLGMYGHWLLNVPGAVLFDDLGPFVDTYIDEAALCQVQPDPGWLSRLLPWRSSCHA